MFIKRRINVISIIRSPTQLSIPQMYNKSHPPVRPLKMFGSVKSKITLNSNRIKKIPSISRYTFGIDFIASHQTGLNMKTK